MLLYLLACGGNTSFLPTATTVAPAVTLLARLSSTAAIVEGAVVSEQYVDIDGTEDERYAFRYAVIDEQGERLYERTASGPIIVRDFLAYYSELSGTEILDILPGLGEFPIQVPLLEGAARVDLEIRDNDGIYQPMSSFDLSQLDALDQGVSEAVVGSQTLVNSGPSEHRLDVVLVGDGYTEAELPTWEADAQALTDRLLATEPFATLAPHINVHRVDAVSAESGVSYDCVGECAMRDTAFQTVFALEAINLFTGTNYRTEAVFQLKQWEVARAVSVVPWDMVIVVANTAHDGGFAVHYATVPNGGADWTATGVHEFGHIMGVLGDEYTGDFCIRTDALGLPENITDNPENPPWSHWVEPGTPLPTPSDRTYNDVVGAFSPAYNCDDLYRPAMSCVMNGDSDEFCPVCAELLARRVFRYGDPADAVSVAGDTFSVEHITDVAVEWWVDGEKAGEGASFTVPDKKATRIEAQVQATSDFVREDQGDLRDIWTFERAAE